MKDVSVNIKDVDKILLLEYIWKSKPFRIAPEKDSKICFDKEKAKEAIGKKIFFFCGKIINLDLSKDEIAWTRKEYDENVDIMFEIEGINIFIDRIKRGEDPYELMEENNDGPETHNFDEEILH